MGYALTRGKMICLDLGHFHPTESVADKISAILPFSGEILLHVSRGVRWDSDHVVLLNDEVRDLAAEIVRSQALDRIHIALDYFDASMNRIGAWVLGARSVLKGLLIALLEPRTRSASSTRRPRPCSGCPFSKSSRPCPSARSGTPTASGTPSRPARNGSGRSRPTSAGSSAAAEAVRRPSAVRTSGPRDPIDERLELA